MWQYLLPLAGSILGGIFGGSAARDAANTQADAGREAAGIQKEIAEKSLAQQRQLFDETSKLSKEQFEQQLDLYNRDREEGQRISRDQYDAAYNEYQNQFDDALARENQFRNEYFGIADPRDAETRRLLEEQRQTATGRMQPYSAAGTAGLKQYQDLLGLSGDTAAPDYGKYSRGFTLQDFQQDPGYAFRVEEGLKALDRTAAARGGLLSGQTVKAAQKFGQDLASQEYQNAFNRYQTERAARLSPLEYFTNLGKEAAQTQSGYGRDFAANIGDVNQNYTSSAGNVLRGVTSAKNALGSDYARSIEGVGQNFVNNYMGTRDRATQGTAGARSNYVGNVANAAGQYGSSAYGINQNYGNQASDLATQRGNAMASGQVGTANAFLQGLNSLQRYYQDQDLMNRLGYNQSNSYTSPGYAQQTVSAGYYPAEYGPQYPLPNSGY